MGFFDGIFNRLGRNTQERTITTDSLIQYINTAMGNGKIAVVTPEQAHKINALYACINLITDVKSLVSAKIYRANITGKELITRHDTINLLTREPNDYQSYVEFEKHLIANYLIWGNGYAEIERNTVGRPIAFHILNPWEVTAEIKDRKRIYEYSPLEGEKRMILASNMLHISDIAYDGNNGTSRVEASEDPLKEFGAITNYSREMYQNGVYLSGYIHGEKSLTQEVGEVLRKSFETKYGSKSGQVAILPHGFKYEPLKYNLPMAEANMILAKNSSIEDIARMYRVPLTLIMRGEYADNKGDNEYNTFLSTVIAPLAIMIEAEYNRKLFRPSEIRNNYYIKFELKGLERTNLKDRYEAHRIAINAGFVNADEVRAIEGFNPTEDGSGKEYMKPLNSIPGSMWNQYFEFLMTQKQGNGVAKEL